MPTLWRYLISHYLKVLFLCVVSFIAILLTTRLQEIAYFAALGGQWLTVLKFAFFQIPYILPIAFPVSCLISSIILVQKLSKSNELTALRASGFGLKNILTPLLITASFLAISSFYIISEVATSSHVKSKILEQEFRSINPLLLLENRQMSKLKGIYVNCSGPSKYGEYAEDVVVGIFNKKNNRLNILVAKQLQTTPEGLWGKDVSVLNATEGADKAHFDNLLIENVDTISTPVNDCSLLLKTHNGGRVHTDYLKLSLLLNRTREDLQALKKAEDTSSQKFYKKRFTRDIMEILRRSSLAFSILTFTIMGLTFGINISRKKTYKGIFIVISLAALFLSSYFIAKGLDYLLIPAISLYILPHVLILAFSVMALRRISQGVE